MKRKGIIIVVSGFSGTGKGTLMKQLVQNYDNYALSVSMTTRSPRPGEKEGKEYFFVSREEFVSQIKNGGLIEYASYCEHYYGTPGKYVEAELEAGRDVILEIEIQGALKVKEKYPTALLLFVMPPNAAELRKRLEKRGTESPEIIRMRLVRALEESKGIEKYDFIVINDKLEECVRNMHSLIQAAHEMPERNVELIDNIRKELKNVCV